MAAAKEPSAWTVATAASKVVSLGGDGDDSDDSDAGGRKKKRRGGGDEDDEEGAYLRGIEEEMEKEKQKEAFWRKRDFINDDSDEGSVGNPPSAAVGQDGAWLLAARKRRVVRHVPTGWERHNGQ